MGIGGVGVVGGMRGVKGGKGRWGKEGNGKWSEKKSFSRGKNGKGMIDVDKVSVSFLLST